MKMKRRRAGPAILLMISVFLLAILAGPVYATQSDEPTQLLIEAEATINSLITEIQKKDQQLSSERTEHSKSLDNIENAVKAEREEWTATVSRQAAEIDTLEFWNKVFYGIGCILLGGVVGLSITLAFQ